MTLQWFGLLGAIRSSQRALSLLRHREYSPLTPVSLRTLSPFPASLRAKRSNLFSLSCVIASVTKRSFFPVVCHCERSDAIFFFIHASSRAKRRDLLLSGYHLKISFAELIAYAISVASSYLLAMTFVFFRD